jgi:hypothetical protein
MSKKNFTCKRKVIMSPFSKIEMSPLISFLAWEVGDEGEGRNEHKRSRSIRHHEANRKKNLTLKKASEELGLSLRHTKRIKKRYVLLGVPGLISLKRGKAGNRKIPEESRCKVIGLIKDKYSDLGPTLLSEKLEELDRIKISSETLRKWLIEEKLWKSKRKKEAKVYQRRTRISRFGELIQGDGSPEKWFEERGDKCTLLQFVNDATSNTTSAKFMPAETTEGYLDLFKYHIEKYGKPLALYVDKHSIFRVNREQLKKGIAITHFGQVLKDLDIELICANSPQAKGRVERKNSLFQDRLYRS